MFARAQTVEPLPTGRVVFYGSSSIRLWASLETDFAGTPVLNRGFGGSTLEECVHQLHWIVYPLQPRALVFYAGDNDLDNGAPPEKIYNAFAELVERIGEQFGQLPMAYISIKPSPARYWNVAKIRQANELVRVACSDWPQVRFLDVYSQMLQADGGPRRDLYTEDGLHMNRAGYQLWAAAVRAWLHENGLEG